MHLRSDVHSAVDARYFLYPFSPLTVFQPQYFVQLPVKMVGNVGYLLVQLVERIAGYSPPKVDKSTSTGFPQWGQVISRFGRPVSLIFW